MGQINGPRPRVLHLFSEWKWTGPAEPIVNLCRHLRRHGYVVDMACARPPGDYPQSLEHRARERRVEPILDFHLRKGGNPFTNFSDIRQITEFIDREEVQIIHCHTGHDHFIGSRAARRANNQPFVVRSNHTGVPLKPTIINRWLVRGHTDAWIALTPACRDEDARRFGINPKYAVAVEGSVDLDRFNTVTVHSHVRDELGYKPEHVVAGIVARVQPHRRFDVLMPALAKAMAEEPNLRAMVIGRGTRLEELAKEPARELGITDKVLFTGYRSDDYVAYLASLDFKIFLVPGSDGSCRAVREAMAMGKPILCSRRGLLPELVEDGRCGVVVDDTVENLTEALVRLARNRTLREKLGKAAAAKAKEQFNVERQVEAIAELYTRLAEGR